MLPIERGGGFEAFSSARRAPPPPDVPAAASSRDDATRRNTAPRRASSVASPPPPRSSVSARPSHARRHFASANPALAPQAYRARRTAGTGSRSDQGRPAPPRSGATRPSRRRSAPTARRCAPPPSPRDAPDPPTELRSDTSAHRAGVAGHHQRRRPRGRRPRDGGVGRRGRAARRGGALLRRVRALRDAREPLLLSRTRGAGGGSDARLSPERARVVRRRRGVVVHGPARDRAITQGASRVFQLASQRLELARGGVARRRVPPFPRRRLWNSPWTPPGAPCARARGRGCGCQPPRRPRRGASARS